MNKIHYYLNLILYGNRESWLHKDKISRIDDSISRLISKNRENIEIADLGCGIGHMSIPLLKLGYKVTGIEINPKSLTQFKSRIHENKINPRQIKIVNSSIEKYQTAKKFDVILLTEVLEHVNKPEAMLKKISYLLTKDGLLFLSVPNGLGSYEFLIGRPLTFFRKLFGIKTDVGLYHINFFSYGRIKQTIKNNNFKIIELVKSSFFPIIPRNKILESIDLKIAGNLPPIFVNDWMFLLRKDK